jgi:putative membrane protein
MRSAFSSSLLIGALLVVSVPVLAAETPSPLNDPQIATVALTAHQIDIDRGKLAEGKTKNAEVKQFAEAMVKDHTAGKQEVLDLAKKLGVKPEESAVTRDLNKGAKETEAKLKKLTGAAFDKAYVDAEVGYHLAVIDAVEKVLIPGAKNAEVKEALVNTVPTLQGHLKHAQHLQAMVTPKN